MGNKNKHTKLIHVKLASRTYSNINNTIKLEQIKKQKKHKRLNIQRLQILSRLNKTTKLQLLMATSKQNMVIN